MKAIEAIGKVDGNGRLILPDIISVRNTSVKVILLVPEQEERLGLDEEREEWLQWSASGLDRAYGDDEPEYTLDQIIEPNPRFRQ